MGARCFGFQKSEKSVEPDHPRCTMQTKPLLPLTAVVYPLRVRTSTSAASEMDFGAALRASAISAVWSGMRYWASGAMAGYGFCARALDVAPGRAPTSTATARKLNSLFCMESPPLTYNANAEELRR